MSAALKLVAMWGLATATWNPDDKGSRVTLSNNLTTAAKNGTSGSGVGVRAVTSHSAGKYYIEYSLDNAAATNTTTYAGISTGSNDLSSQNASNGVYVNTVTPGPILANGVSTGKQVGATSLGDVIGIAVDLDNAKFWARVNNGAWNGDGSADPATNVGGISIAATPPLYPALSFSDGVSAAQITAAFGLTSFTYTPPSGFSIWG